MSTPFLSQGLKGKTVVSVSDGQIIAKVTDVLIDLEARQVAVLIVSKSGLFKRGATEAIPGKEVQVWGQDVILVSRPDVVISEDQLFGREKWLSVPAQIKGRTVVGTDGTRIGELQDLVIDAQGQVIAYELARVFVGGPVAESKRIAIELTSSLGPDVLIVDANFPPAEAGDS